MKNLAVLLLIVIVAFVGYALFWPSEFMPQPWHAPPAQTGAASVASAPLEGAQRLAQDLATGPEDIAIDRQGRIYAGYEDGTIRRFDANGENGEVFATTNGRPLGLAFTDGPVAPAEKTAPSPTPIYDNAETPKAGPESQTLVVADAEKGLLAVNADGDIKMLARGVNDTPFGFTDDVDVAGDGSIYFTDASSKYGRHDYRTDILEHGGHGRLMKYDPISGRVTVLLGGLQFANGVAVSGDDAYVLVTETGSYRVLRYWLTGDDAGQSEVFIDNLPGFPDGISYSDESDTFWVALFAPRNRILDFAADKPWLRRIIFNLPQTLQPAPAHVGRLLGLDGEGRIVTDLQDTQASAFAPITSVEQAGEHLYLGSLIADSFARIPVPQPTVDTP